MSSSSAAAAATAAATPGTVRRGRGWGLLGFRVFAPFFCGGFCPLLILGRRSPHSGVVSGRPPTTTRGPLGWGPLVSFSELSSTRGNGPQDAGALSAAQKERAHERLEITARPVERLLLPSLE